MRIAVNLARTIDCRVETLVGHLLDAAESQISVEATAVATQANSGPSPDQQKACARVWNLINETKRDLAAFPQATEAERRRVGSLSARYRSIQCCPAAL